MKYHIPKGTKIRRIRWDHTPSMEATEAFVTTRDVTYGDSDVVAVVELEQSYLEFRIPLPNDAGAHPTDPEPKELSPFKSIKVLKARIEFIAENESEKAIGAGIQAMAAMWDPDEAMGAW